MIYLSGAVRPDLPPDVGVMVTPMMGTVIPPGRLWAADSGCFANPGAYSVGRYLRWLERHLPQQADCLFACAAPDTLGDAARTLAESTPLLPILRQIGYPAAFIAQDGLEHLPVPWDAFDCLFIGGTTEWKLSRAALRLMRVAKERGKWVHVGRVNSFRRLRLMASAGADSVDGTYVKYAPDLLAPRLAAWLRRIEVQPDLWSMHEHDELAP